MYARMPVFWGRGASTSCKNAAETRGGTVSVCSKVGILRNRGKKKKDRSQLKERAYKKSLRMALEGMISRANNGNKGKRLVEKAHWRVYRKLHLNMGRRGRPSQFADVEPNTRQEKLLDLYREGGMPVQTNHLWGEGMWGRRTLS